MAFDFYYLSPWRKSRGNYTRPFSIALPQLITNALRHKRTGLTTNEASGPTPDGYFFAAGLQWESWFPSVPLDYGKASCESTGFPHYNDPNIIHCSKNNGKIFKHMASRILLANLLSARKPNVSRSDCNSSIIVFLIRFLLSSAVPEL